MIIFNLADFDSQTFSFNDEYSTVVNLKCPTSVNCIDGQSITPIIDVFVDGFNPVYGVPLSPYSDILEFHISSGCLPIDYGALIAIPNSQGVVDCNSLFSGEAALVYFSAAEVLAFNMRIIVNYV